jgi:hypothetical protein
MRKLNDDETIVRITDREVASLLHDSIVPTNTVETHLPAQPAAPVKANTPGNAFAPKLTVADAFVGKK